MSGVVCVCECEEEQLSEPLWLGGSQVTAVCPHQRGPAPAAVQLLSGL